MDQTEGHTRSCRSACSDQSDLYNLILNRIKRAMPVTIFVYTMTKHNKTLTDSICLQKHRV